MREVQITNEATQEEGLLDILLTEVRIRRLRTVQNIFWSRKRGRFTRENYALG
jgi:hypothetical protein